VKAAIYARVSTEDQHLDNQLAELRRFAAQQGWAIVREYTDKATAKNGDRTGWKQMWKDVASHRFDVLLFWSLDRLTREGVLKTHLYLKQLTDADVKFKSYTEQYVDSLGVFGDAIIGMLAAVAQQERIRISDRTKAGLARARKAGKILGARRIDINMSAVQTRLDAGKSLRSVARSLSISPGTLLNRMNESAMV